MTNAAVNISVPYTNIAVPFYILTSKMQGFQFLCIITQTYFSNYSHFRKCKGIYSLDFNVEHLFIYCTYGHVYSSSYDYPFKFLAWFSVLFVLLVKLCKSFQHIPDIKSTLRHDLRYFIYSYSQSSEEVAFSLCTEYAVMHKRFKFW